MALGLVACSSSDNVIDGIDPNLNLNTYVSLSLKFPTPSNQFTKSLPGDFNSTGETWLGRDKIESVAVFLVNRDKGTVDLTELNSNLAIDNKGVLDPNIVIKTSAGDDIDVYAVVNGKKEIINELSSTEASGFKTQFESVQDYLVADVTAVKSEDNKIKEVVMMTNSEFKSIKPIKDIKKEEAPNSKNALTVPVERVVARAILTVGDNNEIKNKAGEVIATVKDIKYVVGQSNKNFYLTKKEGYLTPEPVYSFIPTGENLSSISANFDNANLNDFSEVSPITANTTANLKEILADEEVSKFVLPVTHEEDNYRKGNSTFFEVSAKIVPEAIVGGEDYQEGDDLFFGSDKKFYTDRDKAIEAGLKVSGFKGGVMKYIIWLNPNDIAKPKTSPTVRNQVYHAHISGFKEIGLPYNPLNPKDPNTPDVDNPTNPTDPENPENPDPNTPTNPIDPTDPLKTEETYLSVSVQVLEWGIHSYEIDLGNDY